jgi:hypothetical protein
MRKGETRSRHDFLTVLLAATIGFGKVTLSSLLCCMTSFEDDFGILEVPTT